MALIKAANASKVSARNFMQGKVTNLTKAAVNTDVTITGDSGMAVSAIITETGVGRLGLVVGKPAAAMFNVSSVIVGVDN